MKNNPITRRSGGLPPRVIQGLSYLIHPSPSACFICNSFTLACYPNIPLIRSSRDKMVYTFFTLFHGLGDFLPPSTSPPTYLVAPGSANMRLTYAVLNRLNHDNEERKLVYSMVKQGSHRAQSGSAIVRILKTCATNAPRALRFSRFW
jgi:hypothetical protein